VYGIESRRRISQVTVRHDVVALEHEPRLIAGQLHRDALRDVLAYEFHTGAPATCMRVHFSWSGDGPAHARFLRLDRQRLGGGGGRGVSRKQCVSEAATLRQWRH
jgi:hypothetical protein